MMFDIESLMKAIAEAKRSPSPIVLHPYSTPVDDTLNEYCFFIKPEITRCDKARDVISLIFQMLEEWDQRPRACCVLGSAYMVQHRLMEQHYGVIDTVSRRGLDAISDQAMTKLTEILAPRSFDEVKCYGAHQFVQAYPFFSAEALAVFYDNLENKRLAGGTHCVRAKVKGEEVILFNGFHPEQLENYTQVGATIAVFAISTSVPWEKLRTELTGVTNPARAAAGSIRRMLYDQKEDLGLPEVSSGRNGIHASAGPVEGMVELIRFMSDHQHGQVLRPDQTSFGHLLMRRGFPESELPHLLDNPPVVVGPQRIPVFDATEEKDATDACEFLLSAKIA